MLRLAPILVFGFFCTWIAVVPPPAQAQEELCGELIRPLVLKKNTIAENGGLWSLFERSGGLKEHSVQGLKIDSKINKILNRLKYLCRTREGVPFTELARYISSELAQLNENKKEFKKKMIILGKSEGEINIWLNYIKTARENQDRTLQMNKIVQAVEKGEDLLEGYVDLAAKIRNSKNESSLLAQTRHLLEAIDRFLSQNPYMVKALRETERVPYWDFEENYGGS